MIHLCKMISPGIFFIFFKILIFWLFSSHIIPQEQYSIWSWFLVHYCKMMISPGIFLIFFLNLIFQANREVKGQKIAQKWEINNNYICYVLYLRNSIAYNHEFWYSCVKWWYLQGFFFSFSKYWFFWFLGGKRAKNGPK